MRIKFFLAFFISLNLIFPLNVRAYSVPSDPGRMSLLQVENGQLINQRDQTQINSYNLPLQFVQGRTPYRLAVDFPDQEHVAMLPSSGNIDLQNGTISFWVLKNGWNNPTDDWFFKADVSTTFAPNDDLEIRQQSGNLYGGYAFIRAVIPFFSPSNDWHLITLTWGEGQTNKLYVDGVLSGDGGIPFDGTASLNYNLPCSTFLCWGGWFSAFSARAVMEDMQIFNYPMSQAQIQSIYSSAAPTEFYSHVFPQVSNISISPNPVTVGAGVFASASFTEPGYTGIHNAQWNWGDGNLTTGTISGNPDSGTVIGDHTYSAPGVYTVTLTLTDNEGDSGSSAYQYISVYNPTPQGLFTGARIFTSPTGAYTQNPLLTGPVQFGVSVKYQNSVPVGRVNMNFNAADFTLESTGLNVFVSTGTKAYVRGTGTINGTGNYDFLVTGLDSPVDLVRFQIKDADTVIYDSQPGAPDTVDPAAPITGQIIIH